MSSTNPSNIERKERFARKMSGKAKPAVRSENRLPPGQHLTPGFPVLDLGIRPEISLADWRLEIGGLVEHPKTFTWEEFNALPPFEDVSDFHCVTTWSKFDVKWTGVAFFTLAELVRPKPEVKHVLFASYDGYTTTSGSTTSWTTTSSSPRTTTENRSPANTAARLASSFQSSTPGKARNSSAQIEFAAEDKLGFWEVRGYSNTADPWTEDRFALNAGGSLFLAVDSCARAKSPVGVGND